MSDPTAPVEGTSTEAPAEATPAAEPWAGVMDRVSELASNIDTRFGQLEQRFQPEPEPEPDPWAAITGQPETEPEQYFDAYGNPVEMQQQTPGLDLNALQQAVAAMQQQAVAPLQEQLQQMQWERQREEMYAEVPQLKDPAVAKQTAEQFQSFLQEAGAPPQVAQWLSNSPKSITQFFKAAEAEKLAQGQAPASEQVPSLEAAGGAVPGGNGEQPNYVQSAHNGAWQLPPGLR